MGKGSAGAHLGRDPDRLHDFVAAGAFAAGQLHVALNAPGALGDMRDCNGDQLLGAGVERAGREHRLAEGVKGIVNCGGQRMPLLSMGASGLGHRDFGHGAVL